MSKQKYNRILTVDCAQNTASQIRHCCRDLYVDFRDYPCADETISVTRANDWDLLIINPESNASMAMDICTTARSVKPLSQIIVVSKDCNDAVIAQWLSHGADDCIATPFSPIEFTARVSAALRIKRATHCQQYTAHNTRRKICHRTESCCQYHDTSRIQRSRHLGNDDLPNPYRALIAVLPGRQHRQTLQ